MHAIPTNAAKLARQSAMYRYVNRPNWLNDALGELPQITGALRVQLIINFYGIGEIDERQCGALIPLGN
jgi:hypothetical protein